MTKGRNPTVYLFVNKDSESTSLSKSHGKDASAILSHVQSCRNQKNKQLHMFRVDDGTPGSVPNQSGPTTSHSSLRQYVPHKRSSPRPSPTLSSETSSGSADSVPLSPISSHGSASPQPNFRTRSESDELVDYFDSLCLKSDGQDRIHPHDSDLYHQVVSSEDFQDFSQRTARSIHGYAMLACTASRMAVDAPIRREELEIRATRYMQPSLQYLREQLADARTRVLSDRQILREMLLHCVTNWYLCDFTAAQTHLNAMSCFFGCLDSSRSSDQRLMNIINQCAQYITKAQGTQCENQDSGRRTSSSVGRSLSRVV